MTPVMTPAETEQLVMAIADAVADRLRQQPKLLTLRQLAVAMGLSESSIKRLRDSGAIPELRVGGLLRFDFAKVVESLEKRGGDQC